MYNIADMKEIIINEYLTLERAGKYNINATLSELKKTNFLKETYMIYENEEKKRLVFGKYATIEVKDKEIILNEQGKTHTYEVFDPLKQMEEKLQNLYLKDWTAYGYVAFDIVKHYYTYEKEAISPDLSFFIPKTELYFEDEYVTIKTLEDPENLEKILACLSDKETNYKDLECNITLEPNDKEPYMDKVSKLTQAIKERHLTKAILSRKKTFKGTLDVAATYLLASNMNNSARSYAFEINNIKAVGCSPEILLASEDGRKVVTNPLAGTRRRGSTLEEDNKLKMELYHTPKEVKEHALSVLLAQEELNSVCEKNSTHVYDFMEIKDYRCVQHLSSRVAGVLEDNKSIYDALKAVFPGVTISGISKEESIKWVDKLETEPRGIYSGAIGWINSKGATDLAIAIRSVYQYDDEVTLNAGAGIVEESEPEFEYIETFNKMNTIGQTVILK